MHTFTKNTIFLLLVLIPTIFFQSCNKGAPEEYEVDREFQAFIQSFTSGVISASSPITVKLVNPIEEIKVFNESVDEKLFSISPKVKGTTVWENNFTLSFFPDEKLKSGETYWIEFHLGKVMDVDKKYKILKFPITIIDQAISIYDDGLKTYDSEEVNWYQLHGSMFSADAISEEELNENVSISVNEQQVTPKWRQEENRESYTFVVDSIPRLEKRGEIEIQWNTYPYKKDKGKDTIKKKIPALGDFEVISHQVIQSPEQYAVIQFSDPLSPSQNLNGLVEIEGEENQKSSIHSNELHIYPANRLVGKQTITISGALKNSSGYSLNDDAISLDIVFEALKPEIHFVGEGNILPSSNNMLVPFEAVNLKAVDVRIIKIFEENVQQFFQVNALSDESELKRVARIVRTKTIDLNKKRPSDLGKWNRYNLDLSEYIKVEQGAIYRVELSFRKHQSVYPCDDSSVEEDFDMDEENWDFSDEDGEERWDYVSDWSVDYNNYSYFNGYDYRQRENPCSYSYYTNTAISKNIFATDIGIIAKRGTNGETMAVINDIVSSQPISDVNVKFYDYQQQELGSATTNKEGIAILSHANNNTAKHEKVFFIVATYKGEKGYLRLGDGNELSTSRFDISGTTIQDGIKGYIYGERDVWRPGDTLFLNFILEDKDNLIPANHPVIFELFNARGQLVERTIRKESFNNFYNFSTPTEMDAPTGNWRANVEIGGATFSRTIKVETIKPNRLKVKLTLKDKIIRAANPVVKGDLQVDWLHGVPGRNLKTDIEVKVVEAITQFDKFPNYSFDDPSKYFYTEEEKLVERRVDSKGHLSFSTSIGDGIGSQAPGMLRAIFKTRAHESGGDMSTNQMAVPFSPYTSYAGILSPEPNAYGALETDTTYSFDVATVQEDGKIFPNRKVEIKIYAIDWSWWWQAGDNNAARYISRENVRPISSQIVQTNGQGKGVAKVRINKHDWGRYFIQIKDLSSGHSAGMMTYFDWPSWMSRSGRATPNHANMLQFSSDKEEYQPGEKAKLSFPSASNGHALISIESGKKVIDAFWIKTEGSETQFELPITPDLAPNCYVYVTFLQPHKNTENDAPLRMYGITPISVKDPETILKPTIKMPKELSPNSTYKVSVSEENNKEMTYTLAVVDEGLLDLTNFETPNPWNHFYAREALGVKTWDMYNYVINAYGAKVENILTIGGDKAIQPGEEKPMRFKPMVRFIGPFKLEKGKTNTHTIDVPNYIGSVRTMVVAGQENTAYGNAEETTPVKTPLMIQSTLPRVLGPKEKVRLPINIFAMDKKVKNVSLKVKTNQHLKVVGKSTKTVTFSEVGDQVEFFELEVSSETGTAKVEVEATSGKEKSTETIELEVRQPNLPVTITKNEEIESNKEWSGKLSLPGMENSNSAVLELSTIPSINLEKRLDYLLQYPHGCIEQKTSGVFPQLFLSNLIDVDAKAQKRIDDNVRAMVQKIQRHQVSNGGFSFWERDNYAHDWGTSYAGHFMIEAEKRGYNLPYGLKEKWLNYQKTAAQKWTPTLVTGARQSDLPQAYRLYTLALAGQPLLSAMNKLRVESNLSIAARWRLAAAYQMAGKSSVAKEVIQGVSTVIKPYTELNYSFGNETRDAAMIIETLTLMKQSSKAVPLVKEISEKLSSNEWMSTQTTGYALMAVAQFTKENKPDGGIDATYQYQGKTHSIKSQKAIELIDLPVSATQKEVEVSIKNKGNGYLFTRLIGKGTPLAGNEVSSEKNLSMQVKYTNLDGNQLDVKRLEQGTDFYVEVTVSNPGMRGDYYELALTQIFPSGWEISNQRMEMDYEGGEEDGMTYQDIRDDRVYSYFDLGRNSKKTVRIKLHASYLGEFYMPAVHIEAMYDNSISALVKGQKVEVIRPAF